MGDMTGQVALVTGGVRGIGAAICDRLAGRGVVVAAGYSRDKDAAERFCEAHPGSSVHQGNIGSAADCERVIAEVLDQHGRLDILVNNAGITIDKTVRKMTPEDWDRVVHVNLSGAFYLARAILQHMLDRGSGRIVNISSVIGSSGNIGQANYAAAKSGMFGLTMSLAQETARKGITVNSVTPGYITTDMTAAVPPAAMEKVIARIPAGRLGEPDEWPGSWSSSPTPTRPTSPGRSTPSTAASTCRARPSTTPRPGAELLCLARAYPAGRNPVTSLAALRAWR